MKTKLIEVKGAGFLLVIVGLLAFWVCGAAFSTVPAPSFTLREAIEMVLLHHPAVREAELNLMSTQLELEATKASARLPQIRLQLQPLSFSSPGNVSGRGAATLSASFALPTGTGLSFNLTPSLDFSTLTWAFSWGLSAFQRFGPAQTDWGSGALHERKQAVNQAETALKRAKDEVVLKVIEQFSKLLAGQVVVTSAEAAIDQKRAQLGKVEGKIAVGQAGELDRLEAELALKKAEIAFRRHKAEHTAVKAEFANQLGIKGPYEVLPPQLPEENIQAMAESLLAIGTPQAAIEGAGEVTRARVSMDAAEQKLRAAQAAALPTGLLSLGWTSAGWYIGVTVDFDLFSPRHSYQIKLAKVSLEIAQGRLKVTQQKAQRLILSQRTALWRAMEESERLHLEKEKWALEETIMQKKLAAEVISTDEWTNFHMQKEAFESDRKQRAFDLILEYLRYRRILRLELNWREILS